MAMMIECVRGGGVDEYVSTAKLGLELVQKTRPLSPTLLLRARTKRQTTFRHGQCSLSHGSGRRRSGAGRRPFFRDRTKPFQTVFFSLVFLKKVQDGHGGISFSTGFLLQRFAHVAEGNCRCRRFGRKSLYQKSEAQAQCDVFLLAHIVVQWPGTHWHAN